MTRRYRLEGLPAPGPRRSRVDRDILSAGFRKTPRIAGGCFVLEVDEEDEAQSLARALAEGIEVAGHHVRLRPYVAPPPPPEDAPASPMRLLAIDPALTADHRVTRCPEAIAYAATRAVRLPAFARALRIQHRMVLDALANGTVPWVDHPLSIELYFVSLLLLGQALMGDRPPELDIDVTLAAFGRSINASSARRESLLAAGASPALPELVMRSPFRNALGHDLEDDGTRQPRRDPDAGQVN